MLLEHRGHVPRIAPSAYVAPTATVCGDVRIGPHCRILFGAVLTAEGGPVELGENDVIMENAVLRGTRQDPLRLGAHCLVGPRAYLVGATIADDVFLATGATVFNGAHVERGCEVRINGTVHLRSRVPAGSTVPIGWVAVGDPARILPPDRHDEIWEIQQRLDFPGYVFGLDRDAPMADLTGRYGHSLGRHQDDRALDD